MVLKYILVLIPMLITYLVGIWLTEVGAYEAWYTVSPIMHGIGGFVTAWTAWMIWNLHVPKKELQKFPRYVFIMILVGVVLFVGISWEWYEYILDVLYDTSHILGVGDTLLDLTMDTVGALVYSLFVLRVDK